MKIHVKFKQWQKMPSKAIFTMCPDCDLITIDDSNQMQLICFECHSLRSAMTLAGACEECEMLLLSKRPINCPHPERDVIGPYKIRDYLTNLTNRQRTKKISEIMDLAL